MRKGFLVISGCPRSGTSLNMDIQRVAHGDDAIIGEKFPQETRENARKEMLKRQEGEPEHLWRCRCYLMDKQDAQVEATTSKHDKKYKDMNPDGFWEMAFTVSGIAPYVMRRGAPPAFSHELQALLDEVESGKFRIVKVVSQGLNASNPRYIGGIVYSIRHPRAVAKSQERLTRGFDYTDPDTGEVRNAFEDIVIHTPEMFIQVTAQAARFLLTQPRIPVHFLHFEDLVSDPKTAIAGIGEFVGRGDYSKASDVVKPKLNRSKHEDIPSSLWEDAEFVYEHFCNAAEIINECKSHHWATVEANRRKAAPELRKILDYMSDPRRNINREKRHWMCYRAKKQVSEASCQACYYNEHTMRNFRKSSEEIEGRWTKHWSEEPCLFECGFDLDRIEEYLTIEESIENNFWKEDPE